jgi:hypothetical protein
MSGTLRSSPAWALLDEAVGPDNQGTSYFDLKKSM